MHIKSISISRWKLLASVVLLIVATGSLGLAQSSYSDFVSCVQSTTDSTWGATCTLPGNQMFEVPSTTNITVGRAPLTIQGSGSNSGLRRAAYTGSTFNGNKLLWVPPSVATPGGSGPYPITIQYLTFDGNRVNQCISSGHCATYNISTIDGNHTVSD